MRGMKAFTLLELIVVMLLMASMFAMAAPSLRGFFRSSEMQQDARMVLGMMHKARVLAMREGKVYWVAIDEREGELTLYLPGENEKTEVKAGWAKRVRLKDGIEIAVEEEEVGEEVDVIVFEPGGASTPVCLRLSDDSGTDYLVKSESYDRPFEMYVEARSR